MNKTTSIDEIKELWEALYNKGNSSFSPYQSFEWNKCLEINNKKKLKSKPIIYYYFDDFIAPLIVDARLKEVKILGAEDSSDYLSFVFDCNEQSFNAKLMEIIKKFPNYKITLSKINESSEMFSFIKKFLVDNKIDYVDNESICVEIPLGMSFDDYFNSLTKSHRQNYRTAINKIHREHLDYSFYLNNGKVSQKKAHQLFHIYKKRRQNVTNKTLISKIKYLIKNAIKRIIKKNQFDCLSHYSLNNDVILFEIFINNRLAAFYEGVYDKNNSRIIISRVATNKKFYWCSPGQIALVDAIKYLASSDKFKNVKYLDLTRGAEKYKYDFGGKEHKNHSYSFHIS